MVIHQLYTKVMDEVLVAATPQTKVESMVASIKASRTEIQIINVQLEKKLFDLQAPLQPATPPKVRAQHTALVAEATNFILEKIVQGAQLVESTMKLWTLVQFNPVF